MTEFTTKLPAMTMSMEGFRDLAVEGGEMDTSEAAGARAAIVAGAAASGGGANDRKSRDVEAGIIEFDPDGTSRTGDRFVGIMRGGHRVVFERAPC